MNIRQSIAKSAHAFQSLVWPEINHLLGGGELISVETVTDSRMADYLDWYAGIDAWLVRQPVMFGIASRVQWGQAWDTFTVRSSRPDGGMQELQKRRLAISNGSLWPRYTVQAYICADRLESAAIVETDHLIALCDQLKDQERRNQDGTRFRYVKWSQCDESKILTWYSPALAAMCGGAR